jgi:hypothetical protein
MGTWNMNANGTTGTLILSASTGGGITGTLSLGGGSADPITAVWDETSQTLSFSRGTQGAPAPFAFEVYTGTLFQPYDTPNGPIAGEGVPLMLAGNFGQAIVGGAIGPFQGLGWFATSQMKFKEKEGKEGKEGKDFKDHKDGKDKEQKDHKEKEPADLPRFQTLPDIASAEQAGDAAHEVRFATGRSFVPSEERPQVGASALQAGSQT